MNLTELIQDGFVTFQVELTERWKRIAQTDLSSPNYVSNQVRLVDVPAKRLFAAKNKSEILELVFEFGQNDFQQKNIRSVSVGDVVRFFNGERWAIDNAGWVKVEEAN